MSGHDAIVIRAAGAAKGLWKATGADIQGRHGLAADARFAPVGAILDQARAALAGGERCDLIVLTPALIAQLQAEFPGRVAPAGTLGTTATTLAARADAGPFDIATEDALRRTLAGLDAVLTGDTTKSTVGRHLVHVMEALGLTGAGTPPVRAYAGGEASVVALADTPGRVLACAQKTEVTEVAGAVALGPFPGRFHLATEYALAVVDGHSGARAVAADLCGAYAAAARHRCGFEAP